MSQFGDRLCFEMTERFLILKALSSVVNFVGSVYESLINPNCIFVMADDDV